MRDEDFVMGYAVGYNDGVGSGGGSSGGLDDYPVFKNKKFRFGDSDFYFMVGDINTGFYDDLNYVNYDSDSGAYTLKYAFWYRHLCIILCKGTERFAAFKLGCQTPYINTSPLGSDGYSKTTYYLDDVSCKKVTPSSSTGAWQYSMIFNCHYDRIYSDGSPSYTGTANFDGALYDYLYFNADGTVNRAPNTMLYNSGDMHCLNDGYFAELMDLMLTLPEIIEEV